MQIRVIGNGRYRLEKRLGQGGFGTTWLAADQENQQKVVVKELCPPQGEKREKEIRNFLREARVMASLHAVKEIVKVLNYFEEQGNAYIYHGIPAGNQPEALSGMPGRTSFF